ADGQVLYTLASVVDDTEMGITHVVRGSDHVTNTATQIQIMGALGQEPPAFAHHSLLTGPQGEALSKRLGTLALRDLRAAGIEPLALLSQMARLGSSQPVDIAGSLDEIAAGFDLTQFGAAPTKFDVEDLKPLTARLLHTLPQSAVAADLAEAGVPDALAARFWDVARDNIETRADIAAWWAIFRDGAAADVSDEDRAFVQEAFALLPDPPYTADTWGEWTAAVKEATGRKGRALFKPLRNAVTGRSHGPEMVDVMALMQVKPRL
ncbi:MAG: glutamate--tRNA ligase family protein, partial [Pseudomonadota bacterium]